ncbi:MAG: 3-deoxy-manno-octulosonate cytidylyltransferase [Bacteroidota bacterium]
MILTSNSLRAIGIIPARYDSTRFPGKPLALINGISMIQRVYEQAKKCTGLVKVYVATDDVRIEDHVNAFGGNVIMTSHSHRTGTERVSEVVEKLQLHDPGHSWDVVINIQGDEPYIDPAQIDALIACFRDKDVQIATLIHQINSLEELIDPNVIKVIIDKTNRALCFSRAALPFMRGAEIKDWLRHHIYFKHIGLYAYRPQVLEIISRLKPSPIEIAESLEQMRWIENGFFIHTDLTNTDSISVDTPEDLLKLTNIS